MSQSRVLRAGRWRDKSHQRRISFERCVRLRVGDDGLFQSREMMAERALYVALPVLEVCSPTVGSVFEGTK
jgi:hypothetical protein